MKLSSVDILAPRSVQVSHSSSTFWKRKYKTFFNGAATLQGKRNLIVYVKIQLTENKIQFYTGCWAQTPEILEF